jgi:hypothetical protein
MSKKLSFNYEEKIKLWGEELTTLNQVGDVFISYLNGSIKKFPFAEGHL